MTYILLLLIDVTNLEPDISVGEGTGRITKYTIKAGERLFIFSLLFVDDAETEKDFVRLVEVLSVVVSKTCQKTRRGKFTFVHAKDRGEGLLGVIEGAVSVIEDANAIPEFWVLLGEM